MYTDVDVWRYKHTRTHPDHNIHTTHHAHAHRTHTNTQTHIKGQSERAMACSLFVELIAFLLKIVVLCFAPCLRATVKELWCVCVCWCGVLWYVLVRVVVWLLSVVVVAVLSLLSAAGCMSVVEWKRQQRSTRETQTGSVLLYAIVCYHMYMLCYVIV